MSPNFFNPRVIWGAGGISEFFKSQSLYRGVKSRASIVGESESLLRDEKLEIIPNPNFREGKLGIFLSTRASIEEESSEFL